MPSRSDYIPTSIRQAVADRANHRCEYCKCPAEFSPNSFTVDHIQPCQADGPTIMTNLAWSCSGCNSRKGAKTQQLDPTTEQLVNLFHPRQQSWSDHFCWNNDSTQVIGKTACGRVTIIALSLNRSGVLNLRRLLSGADLHPPEN